jgi:hypothetical protein
MKSIQVKSPSGTTWNIHGKFPECLPKPVLDASLANAERHGIRNFVLTPPAVLVQRGAA